MTLMILVQADEFAMCSAGDRNQMREATFSVGLIIRVDLFRGGGSAFAFRPFGFSTASTSGSVLAELAEREITTRPLPLGGLIKGSCISEGEGD